MDVLAFCSTEKHDTGTILLQCSTQEKRCDNSGLSAVCADQGGPSLTSSAVCPHVLDHAGERPAQDPEGDVGRPGSRLAVPERTNEDVITQLQHRHSVAERTGYGDGLVSLSRDSP